MTRPVCKTKQFTNFKFDWLQWLTQLWLLFSKVISYASQDISENNNNTWLYQLNLLHC
jgi:hypothetical protein